VEFIGEFPDACTPKKRKRFSSQTSFQNGIDAAMEQPVQAPSHQPPGYDV
jgi:hypothetical protein